ncbi:hypothetical protein GGR58DRAFT_214412 [Xylaria digitata]|nr:hypothetical protein GGR58DRAFT_214412 [Xylaria digitata]
MYLYIILCASALAPTGISGRCNSARSVCLSRDFGAWSRTYYTHTWLHRLAPYHITLSHIPCSTATPLPRHSLVARTK